MIPATCLTVLHLGRDYQVLKSHNIKNAQKRQPFSVSANIAPRPAVCYSMRRQRLMVSTGGSCLVELGGFGGKRVDRGTRPATGGYFMARIDDFDRFRELARGWDVSTSLLKGGGFRSSLFQLVDDDRGWNFAHARLLTPVHQEGATPPGLRTFAVPDTRDVALSWRRQLVDGRCILVYPHAGEHDAITPAGYGAFVLSARENELCAQSEAMGLPEALSAIRGKEVVRCSSAMMQQIRSSMDAYERAVIAGLPPSELESCRRQIIRLLITGLAARTASGRILPRIREKAVREAEAYARENAREAPTVEDLSRYTGSSIRTLQYGFRQALGVSPKAYINATRLNCVRKALADSDPSHIKVSDVANEWGFWHMGSFAADYRKLFGELPSATLSRPKAR